MMPTLDYRIAHAAATDAGDRSMREAGRTQWSQDDYDVMVVTLHRLWPCPLDAGCIVCDEHRSDN